MSNSLFKVFTEATVIDYTYTLQTELLKLVWKNKIINWLKLNFARNTDRA